MLYLHDHQIPMHKVGASYPDLNPLDYSLLNGDTGTFSPSSIGQLPYVLESNVYIIESYRKYLTH